MLITTILKQREKVKRRFDKFNAVSNVKYCDECGEMIGFELNNSMYNDQYADEDEHLCGVCNYKRFIIKDTYEYTILYNNKNNTINVLVKTKKYEYNMYAFINLSFVNHSIFMKKRDIDLHVIEYSSFFQGA